MITEKDFLFFEKVGISFKLDPSSKYANVYKKNKFVGSIYNTNNTIYFCGKDFLETTGKELIEYLNKSKPVLATEVQLSNDEIFRIWKKCVLEDRPANYYDNEFGKGHNYMLNAFKRLKLPATCQDRMLLNKSILSSLLKQQYYIDAKNILTSFSL